MSERTLSPGMDHTTFMPHGRSLETASSSRFGIPVKRKWSPVQSETSTATVRSYPETLRGAAPASIADVTSPRCSKRAKLHSSASLNQVSRHHSSFSSDRSQLPGEMWQHIFTYLPPYCLEQVMYVNKAFNNLLLPGGTLPTPRLPSRGVLRLRVQDQLWLIARRTFFPKMPRPPCSRSEFETWKLVRGSKCQFCGKKDSSMVPPILTSPWTAGPGNDHVRVLWPFAVRSCGNCLRARIQKVGRWTPNIQF
jgi:hypothetical protein